MRQAHLLGLPLLVLGLAAGFPTAVRAADPKPEPGVKWEYRIVSKEQLLDLGKKDLTAGLNALGDEGWELVAAGPEYIFKRAKFSSAKRIAELKQQISRAQSDLDMVKDRVQWAERMVKKGYMTDRQLTAEQAQQQAAELALQLLQQELKSLPPETKPDK
jgi:hypothetical protein